jgi:folylpolyglutamate synthase
VDSLKVIHVAGSKGKGSVCAYTESILRAYGKKTGLFTSPHLMFVRDRFRICAQPLSMTLFIMYFNEVWDRLVPLDRDLGYFQFLTLLSYHVFKQEKVDVCIYEAGVGGEYDATNIVLRPVVTGITTLGIDHVKTLGEGPGGVNKFESLIENIAWHKSGIFKAGSPAFSTMQDPKALAVLHSRALERETTLNVVGVNSGLPALDCDFETEVQKYNASLAVSLANAYRTIVSNISLQPDDQISGATALGLKQCSWQGRFQFFESGHCRWHLDGAHNSDSIKVAARWFAASLIRYSRNHKLWT